MAGVLVLNAGYEPLHRVSLQHAIGMLAREVAVVEEAVENAYFGHFPLPKVLRLVRYVALKWRNKAPKWSRRRLLDRDNGECGYCGKHADTIDHILPLSRGGDTSWLNTVAACFKCNNKKGSRTVTEAHMALRQEPFVPSWWHVTMGK